MYQLRTAGVPAIPERGAASRPASLTPSGLLRLATGRSGLVDTTYIPGLGHTSVGGGMEEADRARRRAAMPSRILEFVGYGEDGSKLPAERQIAREFVGTPE